MKLSASSNSPSIVNYADQKLESGQRSLLQGLKLLEDLKKSKNLAELLYNISQYSNIQLTSKQMNHIGLKKLCDKGQHYLVLDCPYCHKRHFLKTPCGSFFCRECRQYITHKVKRNARKYLWNCNHFFVVFTLPPEIQNKVSSWEAVHDLKQRRVKKKTAPFDNIDYVEKEGYFYYQEVKKVYCTDLVYKSVDGAIKEYCKKHKLEPGFISMPHSYGSKNLNWFFHLNVLISSKAFSDGKIVDYQINFNELRSIYKKHLHKNFRVPFSSIPQVRFAKRKGSIYISYKKAINIVLDYFRHIPISIKNVKKIDSSTITYQTYKQKKNKVINSSNHADFFNLIMQHIPPKHFRTVRAYGLYSNHNKKRKKYPKGKIKEPKQVKCKECKTTLDHEDFIGKIHNGELVWINPNKIQQVSLFFAKSILDCKDFEGTKMPEIQPNGRLICSVPPPPDLIPPQKVKFPPKNTDLI